MNIVNLLLRGASLAVLLLLIHQLFFSKKGIKRHRMWGKVTMRVGILIFILVVIRAFDHETFTLIYGFHLLVGSLFFFLLFKTGYLGYRSQTDKKFAVSHHRYARGTLIFLGLTLVAGIVSLASH